MESIHHMSNIRWSGPQLRKKKKSLNHGKRTCLEYLESGLEVEHEPSWLDSRPAELIVDLTPHVHLSIT